MNINGVSIGYELSDDSDMRRRYGEHKRVKRAREQYKMLQLVERSIKRSR